MRKHNLRAFACALLAVIFAVSIAGCKADKTTELETGSPNWKAKTLCSVLKLMPSPPSLRKMWGFI